MGLKEMNMLAKLMKNKHKKQTYVYGRDYDVNLDGDKIIIDCKGDKKLAKKLRGNLEDMLILHMQVLNM